MKICNSNWSFFQQEIFNFPAEHRASSDRKPSVKAVDLRFCRHYDHLFWRRPCKFFSHKPEKSHAIRQFRTLYHRAAHGKHQLYQTFAKCSIQIGQRTFVLQILYIQHSKAAPKDLVSLVTWCWTETTGKNISDSSWSKTWTIIRVTVPFFVVLEISSLVTLGKRLSILLCQPSENNEGSLGSILNGCRLSHENWPNFNISRILHPKLERSEINIILVARRVDDRPKRGYECGKPTGRHAHLKK